MPICGGLININASMEIPGKVSEFDEDWSGYPVVMCFFVLHMLCVWKECKSCHLFLIMLP